MLVIAKRRSRADGDFAGLYIERRIRISHFHLHLHSYLNIDFDEHGCLVCARGEMTYFSRIHRTIEPPGYTARRS